MEFPIRVVIVIAVLLVAVVIILSLFGIFGERSNWLIEGIFKFFENLFGGGLPPTP